jgi:predicted TIM-barrel fold metal-dependent hydrolase
MAALRDKERRSMELRVSQVERELVVLEAKAEGALAAYLLAQSAEESDRAWAAFELHERDRDDAAAELAELIRRLAADETREIALTHAPEVRP